MRFRARFEHQMVKARHLTGEDIERAWGEFKRGVMQTAKAACGRRTMRSDMKQTKWRC